MHRISPILTRQGRNKAKDVHHYLIEFLWAWCVIWRFQWGARRQWKSQSVEWPKGIVRGWSWPNPGFNNILRYTEVGCAAFFVLWTMQQRWNDQKQLKIKQSRQTRMYLGFLRHKHVQRVLDQWQGSWGAFLTWFQYRLCLAPKGPRYIDYVPSHLFLAAALSITGKIQIYTRAIPINTAVLEDIRFMSDWNMYVRYIVWGQINTLVDNNNTYATFGASEPMGQGIKYIPVHNSQHKKKKTEKKKEKANENKVYMSLERAPRVTRTACGALFLSVAKQQCMAKLTTQLVGFGWVPSIVEPL